jgi:hypothetical protein
MTLLWQTAVSLSEYFKQVIASDASKEEIENAQPRDKITHSYIVPGGVRNDLPDGFADKTLKSLDYFETKRLPEYDKIFYDKPPISPKKRRSRCTF